MKYTILIEHYAQKQIQKLDKKAIPIIKSTISSLADNPRPFGYKKLKGENAYRIRVGDKRDFHIYQANKMLRRAVEREFEMIYIYQSFNPSK